MSGPTIEKMRQQLIVHCAGRDCDICALGKDNINCGTGVFPTALDSLIEAAYKKVFGNPEQVAAESHKMTCREWMEKNMPEKVNKQCKGGIELCPMSYGLRRFGHLDCGVNTPSEICIACWNQPIERDPNEDKATADNATTEARICDNCAFVHTVVTEEPCHSCDWKTRNCWKPKRNDEVKPKIADSGNRREFESGAVRDMAEGKGRCDLMPIDVVGRLLKADALIYIALYQKENDINCLYKALYEFSNVAYSESDTTMLLEVAKHFEQGALKYGENNWQKGIPTWCYIDSAVRHYLKWLRGDEDEPHDRAFVWNVMCCIWTEEND